jgi:tetratricopeptide (TPR) repeat protein
VLTGPAGVGKSALAVTWAHRVADHFPDGQLYAALRGFDPQRDPVDPADLLARFLLALGVPADGVPDDPEDRATLYRSLLARRRVLVLLDDARDAEQVRPLLPASAGSLVLVTSRRRLDGLAVRSGAAVLPVGTLDEDTALALITRAAPEVDPVHAGKLAELCGYLPLALRVAVARLAAATDPGWTVADLVAEMSDDHHRLRSLSLADDDTGVGQVLAVSCRGLPAPDRALFELFGAVPVATLAPHAAAALAETPTTTARDRLRRLADAHLVTESLPDRFAMHDLVRLHARRLAEDGLTPPQRAAARDRLTGYYLVVADQARRLLRPAHDHLDLAARDGGRTARPDLVTPTQAMSWFHGEWTNLVALVHAATEHGAQQPAWQLVRLLQHYCAVRSTADEWFALVRLGLAAARAAGDKVGQVLMLDTLYAAHQRFGRLAHALGDAEQAHRIATELGQPSYLGLAHAQVGGVLHAQRRDQEALVHYRRALELARELGDPLAQARGLNNVAQVERALGDRRAAARHQAAALDLAETLGDGDYLLVAVTNLAELHAELGELAEAEALARRGAVLAAQAGNLAQTAFARKVLGQVLADLGRTAAARAELAEARRLYLRLNSRRATEVERRLAALRSDV